MAESSTLLPESTLQAAVEACFTLRNWRYEVTAQPGAGWATSTVVNGPYGPTLLEVEVSSCETFTIRVEVGPRCSPATRGETALYLAWLNLWLGTATFCLGPATDRIYIRFGVGQIFAGKMDAHRIDRILAEVAHHHKQIGPAVARVARGDMSAAEAMRMIRLQIAE